MFKQDSIAVGDDVSMIIVLDISKEKTVSVLGPTCYANWNVFVRLISGMKRLEIWWLFQIAKKWNESDRLVVVQVIAIKTFLLS